jgi:hypothetical protein
VQHALELGVKINGLKRAGKQPSLPQELLLSLMLRAARQGGFRSLLGHTHGRLRPDHEGNDFLGKRIVTEDRLVNLAPAALVEQARKLDDDFARESAKSDTLKLITKRAVKTHNSWMHNIEEFVADDLDRNYLYVHPSDAERMGLADGDLADVASRTATLRVPIKLLPDLMPGTVALPHGWGHQHATGLSVASKTKGVNVNLLAADGATELERISGMAHLTGIEVQVRRAAGPQDVSSWAGLPTA